MKSAKEVWSKCLNVIQAELSAEHFNQWFVPIIPISYKDNSLLLEVPSHFFIEYIEDNFLKVLQTALYQSIGPSVQLNYRVVLEKEKDTTLDIEGPMPKKPEKAAAIVMDGDPFRERQYQDLDPQLNSKYVFENFYPGASNLLARSAGETAASNPGKTAFNPLFIYGSSGVGKTHLMNAIGARAKEVEPHSRVLYLSSHLFQMQYTDAIRNNTFNDFMNFYQSIDVLLLDDIQEIAGKTATLNTFFHIFNHLHQMGKQIVLSSDRAPSTLKGFEDRLLTRFKWGLSAELEKPDYELRRMILSHKIRREGLDISSEIINYIAKNVSESARDLEGVIISLMAHSMITNRDIDVDLVDRVLGRILQMEKKVITIFSIQEKVSEHYSIDFDLLLSKSRVKEVAQARQVAMFLCKKLTDSSFAVIGDAFGKKNHATVVHACKTVKGYIEVNKGLKKEIELLEKRIKTNE